MTDSCWHPWHNRMTSVSLSVIKSHECVWLSRVGINHMEKVKPLAFPAHLNCSNAINLCSLYSFILYSVIHFWSNNLKNRSILPAEWCIYQQGKNPLVCLIELKYSHFLGYGFQSHGQISALLIMHGCIFVRKGQSIIERQEIDRIQLFCAGSPSWVPSTEKRMIPNP